LEFKIDFSCPVAIAQVKIFSDLGIFLQGKRSDRVNDSLKSFLVRLETTTTSYPYKQHKDGNSLARYQNMKRQASTAPKGDKMALV